MSELAPVTFDAPLVNPAPNGLWSAAVWSDADGPLRWLPSGVDVRVFNFGGEDAFGVWDAAWDAKLSDLTGGDVKAGDRPEFPDTFVALTTFAYDEGDQTRVGQDEVRVRAQQVHRLQEPNAVEDAFAERLLNDAPTPQTVADITAAVAHLEGELAKTNTVGFIHAGAHLAALAASAQLLTRSGSALKSPLGHTWVFGGGYVGALEDTLVATSQPFGWRGPVAVRDAHNYRNPNRYIAIAERSVVVGYEAVIAAAEINTEE